MLYPLSYRGSKLESYCLRSSHATAATMLCDAAVGARSRYNPRPMDLEVMFVGTAASLPTPRRGLSSVLIHRGGDRILVDCGEGTQRQLMQSCGLHDVDLIFLTHMHADHTLGLPGMLKTFGLRERTTPLTIVGPPGIKALFKVLHPLIGRQSYDLDLREVEEGVAWSGDDYVIEAIPTDHTVRSVAMRLREHDRPGTFDVDAATRLGVPAGPLFGKLQRGSVVTLPDGSTVEPSQVLGEAREGRTIIYSGDTRPDTMLRDAAHHASLLIHEATFLAADAARADATGHSTARDAALLAAAAQVQILALTHISTRYFVRDIVAEVRAILPEAVVPRDFDSIVVPFTERGVPYLVPGGAKVSQQPGTAAPVGESVPAAVTPPAVSH